MDFLAKLGGRTPQRLLKPGLESRYSLGYVYSRLQASKGSKHTSWIGPALLLFIKSLRKKNIRRTPRGHLEARRKNTNDSRCVAIQRDRFAENEGIAPKSAFPK